MENAKAYKAALMRKLHAIGKNSGMDHDALSEMAWANYGVSIRGLNIPQLLELINGLENTPRQEEPKPDRSKKEKTIYAIGYRSLKWDSARILDFIEQQIGQRKSVQSLSDAEASKVITGMEAIEKWRKRREVSKVRE
jgi:hypothetical protein